MNDRIKHWRRGVFLGLLATVAAGLLGCATEESENVSARPWNAPKSWETGLPAGLYQGR